MRQMRSWTVLAALLVLAACSKDKEVDQPAKLSPIRRPALRVEHVWSAGLNDKRAIPLRLGLGVAVQGNRVYAAGHRGEVAAFDLTSGRSVWRTRTKAVLSGGAGTDGHLVVVGSSDGQVIALNAADGAIRWRVRLNGEVLSPPAVSERVVAVRTVDGKLRGLSPADGHDLWSQEQQVPRLSLRGTSRPVIAGDVALCGFDNGKVLAVNMNDGSLQWEATIAPPHGRTEIERLVDVDSAVRVSGADVYAVGFQGRVAMLALDTGQIWWSHDASSYRGLDLDDDAVYIATSEGEVVALRRRTGAEIWRQKALLHRGLSAVVATDDALVTADSQGYVHWLDKATGALAARVRAGKVRVTNPPVVAGNMVLVINDAGHISAFRVKPLMTAARAKPPAEQKTQPVPAEAPAAEQKPQPLPAQAPAAEQKAGPAPAQPMPPPEESPAATPVTPEEKK